MSGERKKSTRWNTDPIASHSSPLQMAEPRHRIPPTGASTGQSVRTVSKSSLQLVKEICLHYVQKCSGKYEDNKAAARYVHQMAEEIMVQLGGVANEIKRTRGEPEIYQALLDEWNEHFPASLGAMGSPKAIATLVASQSREITKLKADLETERLNREQDVTGILRSMDSQLHAYRSSVMNDRRQQKSLFEQQLVEYDHKLADLKEEFEAERKGLAHTHHQEMQALQQQYENLLAIAKKESENLRNQLKAEMMGMKKKYQVKMEKLREKNDIWEQKCTEIRGKYNDLAMTLNEDIILDTSDTNDDDTSGDILSSDEEEDHDEKDVDKLFSQEDAAFAEEAKKMLEARRERKRQEREARAKKEKPAIRIQRPIQQQSADLEKMKQLQDNLLVASAQIKRLEKQLEDMDRDNKDRKAELIMLGEKMKDLLVERSLHLKRLNEVEELNESLRRALGVKVNESGHVISESVRQIQGNTQLLCHTPHFLDKPDRSGPNYAPKQLSAYVTAGHF